MQVASLLGGAFRRFQLLAEDSICEHAVQEGVSLRLMKVGVVETMRDIAWRTALTFLALMGLLLLGSNVSCTIDHRLVEWALGQTPEAQIARFLEAVDIGDREAALALWSTKGSPSAGLEARRASVTDVLLAFGPGLEYQILDVEWWRTCCEPGVIDVGAPPNTDGATGQAGGARVRIALSSDNKHRATYVFDVLVPGGYWGEAAGNPVRTWAIVDVYPEGQAPLAWTWK
jgi:hypothetical protein